MVGVKISSALTAILALSCSSVNLFTNPSFEKGREGWFRMKTAPWEEFEVATQKAHTGRHAALLRLRNWGHIPPPRIWGVIQEPRITKLPKKLSFWYRVENWQQPVFRQFIQVVVIIDGNNMQLRYLLGGIQKQPYSNTYNARYRMVNPHPPREGTWKYFETNLQQDFLETWGGYPKRFKKIRFFFEVRYEDPVPKGKTASADLYLDDISLTW